MPKEGYSSISIPDLLVDRVDQLFSKFAFATRTGYINDRLRRAIERDEAKQLSVKKRERHESKGNNPG